VLVKLATAQLSVATEEVQCTETVQPSSPKDCVIGKGQLLITGGVVSNIIVAQQRKPPFKLDPPTMVKLPYWLPINVIPGHEELMVVLGIPFTLIVKDEPTNFSLGLDPAKENRPPGKTILLYTIPI
jgi:hypothetical protein